MKKSRISKTEKNNFPKAQVQYQESSGLNIQIHAQDSE